MGPYKLCALVVLTMSGIAFANFDLYRVNQFYPEGDVQAYQIFQDRPACEEVQATEVYKRVNDASVRRIGVVCEGGCAQEDAPRDFRRIEMHFANNPLYHWSKFDVFMRIQPFLSLY